MSAADKYGAFLPVRMPLVRLAALFVIVAGLKAAEPVFIPMLLAFFLAVLSFPLQALLMRWGVRPTLPLAATVTAVLAVILVVVRDHLLIDHLVRHLGDGVVVRFGPWLIPTRHLRRWGHTRHILLREISETDSTHVTGG